MGTKDKLKENLKSGGTIQIQESGNDDFDDGEKWTLHSDIGAQIPESYIAELVARQKTLKLIPAKPVNSQT